MNRRQTELARLLPTGFMVLTACSTTTYTRVEQVPAPPEGGVELAMPAGAPPAEKGRVVVDVMRGKASVFEASDHGEPQMLCAATPCVVDVEPGVHRYRLVPPKEGSIEFTPDGSVSSKNGAYPAPTETSLLVAAGQTRTARVNLGQTEIRRSFPIGRGIAWAIIAAGAIAAIAGLASSASDPHGSPAEQIDLGIAEMGAGAALLGGVLWSGNLHDNVVITEHPGAVVQWRAP